MFKNIKTADDLQAEAIEVLASQERAKRDKLLLEADIMINKAIDNGDDVTSLRSYRKSLRDVPKQVGFPENIEWPSL